MSSELVPRRGRWCWAMVLAAWVWSTAALGWPAPCAAQVALTLRQALSLALQRNPLLEVERYTVAALDAESDEERAVFDPSVAAQLNHEESRLQTSAREGALENPGAAVRRGRGDQGSLEVRKEFSTGTEVTVSAGSGRSRSSFSAEEYSAVLDLQLRQPLLQGRGREANRVRLRLADNRAQMGYQALRGAVQDLLLGVEVAYWDLVFAQHALDVGERSRTTAEKLLRDTEARVAAGRLPRVEVAAARAEVAARTEAREDARATRERAQLELLRWLAPDRELPWSARLRLLDQPGTRLSLPDILAAVATALAQRPDLLQARIELASGELEVAETRDGLLPRLDLFANLSRHGLGTGWRDSWNTVVDEDFHAWSVALRYEDTFGRRAAKARSRRAGFQRSRAQTAVENLELAVELQVRQAAVEVGRLLRKVELAAVTVAARREEAAAEKARFDAGRATASDVLQAENRLREAQLNGWRARSDSSKAAAEFLRLQGNLAHTWGVDVR